jgi:hypothetical protein
MSLENPKIPVGFLVPSWPTDVLMAKNSPNRQDLNDPMWNNIIFPFWLEGHDFKWLLNFAGSPEDQIRRNFFNSVLCQFFAVALLKGIDICRGDDEFSCKLMMEVSKLSQDIQEVFFYSLDYFRNFIFSSPI